MRERPACAIAATVGLVSIIVYIIFANRQGIASPTLLFVLCFALALNLIANFDIEKVIGELPIVMAPSDGFLGSALHAPVHSGQGEYTMSAVTTKQHAKKVGSRRIPMSIVG